ncbi:MAG TPA: response regulator transcription factor [Thermomicrobiales bacterium]|nr:response regulator transcription factor [Thermomicrobiales bacterium]
MSMTFLVAEVSPDTAHAIEFSAQMSWPGCRVITACDGDEALARFADEHVDAVLLDAHLNQPDGFDLCRCIRAVSKVPILMLSTDNAVVDKVRAFDCGADDYVVKPFDHLELMARLRALLRRAEMGSPAPAREYACGDLAIDFQWRRVRCHGQEVRLTSTEFRLLEVLVRNAGTTMPHHVLLDRVWGSEWAGRPDYLKVFVRRLRQKLDDDAGRPRYIETVWGTGYRFLPYSA